jgi:hypothetical protein
MIDLGTRVLNMKVSDKLQTNEDIQYSFIGRGYQQVLSFVHTIPFYTGGRCHIYSLPYGFKHFLNLNNSFQGDVFGNVRYLSMNDRIPFERNVFQLIPQHFPFLEFLSISNHNPQQDKQHSSTLITLSYLTMLHLNFSHVDYAEQFLLEKNAHLPRLSNLWIEYESFAKITNNFTEDAKHFNFGTLKCLNGKKRFVNRKGFYQYFPRL